MSFILERGGEGGGGGGAGLIVASHAGDFSGVHISSPKSPAWEASSIEDLQYN